MNQARSVAHKRFVLCVGVALALSACEGKESAPDADGSVEQVDPVEEAVDAGTPSGDAGSLAPDGGESLDGAMPDHRPDGSVEGDAGVDGDAGADEAAVVMADGGEGSDAAVAEDSGAADADNGDAGHDGGAPCADAIDECGLCGGPGASLWYRDVDGDGFGDPSASAVLCPTSAAGYVKNDNDRMPDCKANYIDECGLCGGPGASSYYADHDGDGLGDPDERWYSCEPVDWLVDNTDDLEPACASNDTSVCGVCGGFDECGVCGGPGKQAWYADADGDGLGEPELQREAILSSARFAFLHSATPPGSSP